MNDRLDRLRAHLKSELGATWADDFGNRSDTEIIRSYEGMWQGYLAKLAGPAAVEVHADAAVFRRMISLKGALDSSIVNASVARDDHLNSYLIVMNGGISRLIYQVVKLISTRAGVMGIDGHAPVSPRNTVESAVAEARVLMEAFLGNRIMATHGYPIEDLQAHQLQFTTRFTSDVECFVLAHELGHVVLRESNRRHTAYESMAVLCEWLATASGTSLASAWAEELAADSIGVHLTLKLHDNGMDQAAAFSSAELFFLIVGLIEKFFYKRHGTYPPMGTHPPGKIRLQVLRKAAG